MRRQVTVIILLSLLTVYCLLFTPVFAADSTPSANLVQKLNALKTQIASKAAQIKLEVDKRMVNRVLIGQVSTAQDKSFTLATKDGDKIILTNEYTVFSGRSGKKAIAGTKDLTKDDFVISLGDIDDKGQMLSKKVIKQDPVKDLRKVVFGQVIFLDGATITIQTKDNQKLDLVTTSNTNFFQGKDEASFKDVKLGKLVVAVGIT